MRIYDYDTFLKQKEKVTKIKIKDWVDVNNKHFYNEKYKLWGKEIDVTYKKEIVYIINCSPTDTFSITHSRSFYDNVEYVEVENFTELEVE